MKVRVTFDISDTDRNLIGGIDAGGAPRMATREELEEFLVALFEKRMEPARQIYDRRMASVRTEVLATLKGENPAKSGPKE